jgi:hypothetical protein
VTTVPVPTDTVLAALGEAVIERRVTQAREAVRAGRPGYARYLLARGLITAQLLEAQAVDA